MNSYSRTFIINGESVTVSGPDDGEQMLYVLRNQAGQSGPKFGCGVSQCGACTVLIDGAIVRSCVRPVSTVPSGAEITTLDGIGTAEDPHPIQAAFIEAQAGQCAFCANGIIMGALGWLQSRVDDGNTDTPSTEQIAEFLAGRSEFSELNYICRCGAHPRYVAAIRNAAEEMLS